MSRAKAQRIRFGILAARHQLERARITDWQVDYLEGCETAGWVVRDSRRAYEREVFNARRRERRRQFYAYVYRKEPR